MDPINPSFQEFKLFLYLVDILSAPAQQAHMSKLVDAHLCICTHILFAEEPVAHTQEHSTRTPQRPDNPEASFSTPGAIP